MITQTIDGLTYHLKEAQDFSWLSRYGTAFSVIDQTGSGCICFGMENEVGERVFIKAAGAKTVEAEVDQAESIRLLKEAVPHYLDIHHPNLIRYIESFEIGEFFVVVYQYAEGLCLFDHWNFDRYERTKEVTPMMAFKRLPVEKRLKVAERLFSFFETFLEAGYAAVDFYDSSIMYDFMTDEVTFCDIDLFRKMPTFNEAGEDYYGTKRLKAPEENERGAVIDERTSEFTLGAILMDMFTQAETEEQQALVEANKAARYEKGHFIPNDEALFELPETAYEVLMKATSVDRTERYETVAAMEEAFTHAIG